MASGGNLDTKSSDELFDFICTTCDGNDKIVEAVRYCVECQGYCCQACTDIHKLFPTLKTHTLLDASQGNKSGNQQTRLPEFPTERCTFHEEKVINMYCQHHDEVGCSDCIAKDHKSCPENGIYSIPDMLDTLHKVTECKQTRNRLRDLLASMTTIQSSADSKLKALHKAKSAAIEEVHTIQKALESLIMKAIANSKKEIETECKDLEEKILKDKEVADASDALNDLDKKLDKADGNRAQSFVCSKVVEKKMKNVNMEQAKHADTTIQLSFEARKSLMSYINSPNGISQILGEPIAKRGLYKIKGTNEIYVKVHNDIEKCGSSGCCVIDDVHVLVADYMNNKVKRVNIQTMKLVDYCKLTSTPNHLTLINDQTVAVACDSPNRIIFLNIGKHLNVSKQLSMSHFCFGIVYSAGKLYVTNDKASIYVHDMNGTFLNTITRDSTGKKLFYNSNSLAFNQSESKLFVGNLNHGLVCIDTESYKASMIEDSFLLGVIGVCHDGGGNLFVVGKKSNNVVQFDDDGKRIGVVVEPKDGLTEPMSVCFHKKLNKLVVTMETSNIIKVYDLE